MIKVNNSNYNTNEEINETIQFATELGLTVLPVIPKQDATKYPKLNRKTGESELDKDGNPISRFTGKNPSFFDQKNTPKTIVHSAYQGKLPTHEELCSWFTNPATNGIGVLGNREIKLIDIDVKHFDSVSHCEAVVQQWLNKHLRLQQTWIERTRSGGYRIVVKVKQDSTFTNFQFEHYPHHVGEAIGCGRFAVIAPTPGYTVVNRVVPIEIESLESIGVLPTSQHCSSKLFVNQKISRTEDLASIGALPTSQNSSLEVSIYPLIRKTVKDLLMGKGWTKDRSKDITTVIRELYGWKNCLDAEGKHTREDMDDLIQEFAAKRDIDESRLERILKGIDLDACIPGREYYSNDSLRSNESTRFIAVLNEQGSELNPDDPDGVLATLLAQMFSDTLAFLSQKSWFYYDAASQYWIPYEDSQVEGLIMNAIDENTTAKGKYSSNKISGVRRLLKPKLTRNCLSKEDTSELLPLKNGVLDLRAKQLHPHNPKYGFVYQLFYEFDPTADCQLIKNWLLESTGGDALQVEVLRAYLNAILKSRTDLQRYLEIIGVGGSGKSTYVHLAEALVGFENSYSTKLDALENNRFEVAGIIGKKLVTINDSEAYGGSASTLKAITGQDAVRLEMKNKQQGESFIPSAMVLLTSNTSIRSSDYTSGLQRRRLTIHFNHAVNPQNMKNLISPRSGNWTGEFVPYLPGLLNWVLEMSDADVNRFVKDTSRYVPALALVQREELRNSNPLAEWLDESVVFVPDARNYIGNKSLNPEQYLYSNYVNHCENSGTNPVSMNKFSNSLIDICNNQLKQTVSKGKDSSGVFLNGMRLRTKADTKIPTSITGLVLDDASQLEIRISTIEKPLVPDIELEEEPILFDFEEFGEKLLKV